MIVWLLARKDLLVLLRDPRALIILLAMPFIFILVLGVSLGEGFGQKPDDRLPVPLVNLDRGFKLRGPLPWLAATPGAAGPMPVLAALAADKAAAGIEPWSQVVQRDLSQTARIRLEIIDSVEQAKELVADSKRPAVLVFGPEFSERVSRCSFLADGNNPFYRDGVDLRTLDMALLKDPTQLIGSSIIEQVAQGSLLRVVLPWMIGRAFEKIGDPAFIDLLSRQNLNVRVFGVDLAGVLKALPLSQKEALGNGLQRAIQNLYPKYNLTGKTWAALTRAEPAAPGGGTEARHYTDEGGTGLLNRGALRYQILVPSYTVMFAFFLVLTVGWLFVSERRQGTLKRLRAAPVSRAQIVLGKLLPCYGVSVAQGLLLLGGGHLVFGMKLGLYPLWLLPVVLTTSLAAMGLAMLVAALARTETQVSIYGTLLVLVLAGVSGAMMGERSEQMQLVSRFTPHGWALDAYNQLLLNLEVPNLRIVSTACVVLTAFGVAFLALACWLLRLE
jgi:ABC-type transport system involved in multi-copper enzyme maturation permease subunit